MPGARSRRALSEINVTPLVDVVLVLLIIFMLTAPILQSGIEVDVPKTRTVKEITEERLVISVATISLTERRKVRRHPQHLADAVVVFNSPNRRAIAAQGDERNAVLIGQRTLQAQPHNQGIIGRTRFFGRGCSLCRFSGQAS